MFDARLRPSINRPLGSMAEWLHAQGARADAVTIIGFAFGVAGCVAIAADVPLLGLALILLGRLCDGVDGALARIQSPTDRGGYLDIVLDFVVYGSVPIAFAIAEPTRNAVPAVILLGSFMANGSAFLAFAIMAAKRGLDTRAQGEKSFFYSNGLIEGSETILCFCLMCLFASAFPVLALGMAALCYISAAIRITIAYRTLA